MHKKRLVRVIIEQTELIVVEGMEVVSMSEPYPWFNMMVLASAVLASAVSLSGLFPYVGFMVVDLGAAKNEDEAGFYSGFIASGMMAGRFVSSVPWGRIADKYGRKPALISGCISISVFSILFGFSSSLYTAVFARFFLGLFNPVWGIAKALVSELVAPQYEARAMVGIMVQRLLLLSTSDIQVIKL